MSVEEDIELKDLLTQTLMNNGSLAKIKAELRACTFLAFDRDEVVQNKKPYFSQKISTHLESPEGKLMFCIVREFLEFFNLGYTISVFEPESYLGTNYFYEGRNKLLEELNLNVNESVPLLLPIIKKFLGNNQNLKIAVSEINIDNGITKDKVLLENGIDLNITPKVKNKVLNETFDVNTPTTGINGEQVVTPRSEESIKDDTYEGTSSIAEDSVKEKCLIDLDKSVKETNSDIKVEPTKSLLDSSLNDLSAKMEKSKLNKSRCNDLLPSLYNNRDMDPFFESESMDNYEEDFMTGSELDLMSNPSEMREISKSLIKARVEASPLSDKSNKSLASSVTSEDFELDSNIDDILKSNNSK